MSPSGIDACRQIAADVAYVREKLPCSAETLDGLKILGLHCGSGTNLHALWLNTDVLRLTGKNGRSSVSGQIVACGEAFYLQHDASQTFPLADASVARVFAEHFIEHLAVPDAVKWLREMRRVLVPGGILRVSAPDLETYVRGYLGAGEEEEGTAENAGDAERRVGRFFGEHARRLKAMTGKCVPSRRAWMVNQIFFGWGHRWIYDREELAWAAVEAGFAADDVRFMSFRSGADAVMAQLDLPIRNDESLYAELTKR
jgi:predicted SAM-dependent methyltransferase